MRDWKREKEMPTSVESPYTYVYKTIITNKFYDCFINVYTFLKHSFSNWLDRGRERERERGGGEYHIFIDFGELLQLIKFVLVTCDKLFVLLVTVISL